MNMSDVLTRIKLKLGLIVLSTPFDIDSLIVTILEKITIPVFSIYQPYKETVHLETNSLEEIYREENVRVYLLPEWKARKCLYVFNIRYDETSLNGFGYYGSVTPALSGNYLQQAMMSNVNANVINQIVPKMTFHYESPRKIHIYNMYSSTTLTLDLGFEHDKSLASIDDGCKESFYKLALLDVKENLYPTMKMYSTINSAIGNVDLKLDDWAQAEDKREELLAKWDDTYHLDLQPMYYY